MVTLHRLLAVIAVLWLALASHAQAQTRRPRHLLFTHTGALLVYDAQKITGLADGDPVSTWPDGGATANHAIQVSTQRPVYKTNILGGYPVVRFDGSNDVLTSTSDVATPVTWFVISIAQMTNTGCVYDRGSAFTDNGGFYLRPRAADSLWTDNRSGKTFTATNSGQWYLYQHVCNGTHASHSISINGVVPSLSTYAGYSSDPLVFGNLPFRLGAYNAAGTYSMAGDMALVAYWPTFPSAATQLRCADAAALKWRIALR